MKIKKVVAGIDIGGTNTVFGFIEENGNCLFESSLPTLAEKSADQFFERLFKQLMQAFQNYEGTHELVGIGIGAPNANYYKGTVENPPNLNWGMVDVKKIIKKYSPLPTAITNDANAAALGEMLFGAGMGLRDFVVITLGTGLGSGIIVNGELVYGHDGFAGEIGHSIVQINGRDCGCGRKGCLETYASATGIRRTAIELLNGSDQKSELRNIPEEEITSKHIGIAAANGDKLALEAFDYTARILGLELANTVAYLSPEAIILFGGLAKAGDILFIPVKKYMEENLLDIFKNKVRIIPSGLLDKNTAVLGAAALIWNELKKQ